MISVTIALASLAVTGQADWPTGGQVISMMLARYSGLQSLTGNIKLVMNAKAPTGSVAEEVDTVIQYQRPNKLYIRQDRSQPHAKSWIVSSDGAHFSYNFPEGYHRHAVKLNERLVEPVNALDVGGIFGASSLSIGDRSAPLGIAISWTEELRRIVGCWPTHDLTKEVEVGGLKAWKVQGQYTEAPSPNGKALKPVGEYYLIIGKQGDLLEYATQKKIATPIANNRIDPEHPTVLTQTWQVHLEPNGKPAPSLFTVVL